MPIKLKFPILLFCALCTFLLSTAAHAASADEHDSVKIRPHVGIGYLKSGEEDGNQTLNHLGLRALLSAGEQRWYGVEVTRYTPESGASFTAAGIVLEQHVFKDFNMSIGTIGFFDYGESKLNPAGITTNLGWEPEVFGTANFFITYKADFVFSSKFSQIHSLSIGLGW